MFIATNFEMCEIFIYIYNSETERYIYIYIFICIQLRIPSTLYNYCDYYLFEIAELLSYLIHII